MRRNANKLFPPIILGILSLFCFVFNSCDRQSSVEKADKEGILLVGNNSEIQSLDPHIASSVADFKVIHSLFEGLLRGDNERDDLYHPGVASRWEMSDDAREWTFYLNPNIKWSDGKDLTAYDFEYAYHRLLHPQFGGRYADMLYVIKGAEQYNKNNRPYLLLSDIPNVSFDWATLRDLDWDKIEKHLDDPYKIEGLSDKESDLIWATLRADRDQGYPDLWGSDSIGVKAVDAHTLKLTLNDPMPQLPLLILHCTWFPVPKHVIEDQGGMLSRAGKWSKPGSLVSNGSFVLKDHQFNNYLEVRKNPLYRLADEISLNGVRFLPIVNGFTETRMFFDNKLHITNNVPPEMIGYAKSKSPLEFCEDDYYVSIFYRINTQKAPLNDEKVRKALSLAINRDSLVKDVVRGAGTASFGFTPCGAGYETPHQITFNPQLARQLLAEAGYPEGKGFPAIELLTTSREVQKTMAEAIQGMWKKHLNIHIDIRSCEWTAYKQAQNSMNYDLCSSSWSGDYFDPLTFLDLWTKISGNNNTGWSHSDYEALIARAKSTVKLEDRMKVLAEAESLMLSQMPVLPLYWSKRVYLKKPQVRHWNPLLLDNHLIEKVSLQEQSK